MPNGALGMNSFSPLPWYTPRMADFEREVTPAVKTIWPPAPLKDERAPLSFRVEAIELTQSGGRLIVVNHFMRRMFALQMCIFSLSSLSPFYSYWTSPFHHATWNGMLPAVFATYQQAYLVYLLILFAAALFYGTLVAGGNLGGVVLNLQSGTAKAGGRTRLLSEIESVSVIAGQPDILRRRSTVQLQWSDEQNLLRWQKLLLSLGLKTSFVGILRQEANADRIAEAVAEFAGVLVHHQTFGQNSV